MKVRKFRILRLRHHVSMVELGRLRRIRAADQRAGAERKQTVGGDCTENPERL